MLDAGCVKAIAQYAKQENKSASIDAAVASLQKLLPHLGELSKSKKMLQRIGRCLLEQPVTIIAPSCPDYSHENGSYTFKRVGGGIPLLTSLHASFLEQALEHLPYARVHILVADQEADDEALCTRVGLSKAAFLAQVTSSVQTMRLQFAPRGWQVGMMTEFFPELRSCEHRFAETIAASTALRARIVNDTIARAPMYKKIGVIDPGAMHARTVRTAAQYCALAAIVAKRQFLVCNHETVNLAWYNEQQAAVLHNPVRIY